MRVPGRNQTGILLTCLVFAILTGLSTWAQAPVSKSAVHDAVKQLRSDATPKKQGEAPRFGAGPSGALKYFGAAPGAPLQIQGKAPARSPEEKVAAFREKHGVAFGMRSPRMDFRLERSKVKGEKICIRANQTYAGLPVFAGQIVLELGPAGAVEAALAHLMIASDDLDLRQVPLTPDVKDEAVKHAALAAVVDIWEKEARKTDPAATFTPKDRALLEARLDLKAAPTLVVYDPSLLHEDGAPCLAWVADTYDTAAGTDVERVLVSASTGKILLHYPLYYTAIDREIYDADNTRTYGPPDFGTLARGEGDPSSSVAQVNAAYNYAGLTYGFFSTVLGRNGIDGNDAAINVSVRWCIQTVMCDQWGFCGSGCPWVNGAYFPNSTTGIMLGEDFAVCDVIGHEYTHGVTYDTCSLIYSGESGAICESLSDAFGEFVDLSNGSDCPWRIGEDIGYRLDPTNYPNIYGVRDMADPSMAPFHLPDHMKSAYWDTGGSVHQNAGVGDKLAYLLVVGGAFNGYTVRPLVSDPNHPEDPFIPDLPNSISTAAQLYYRCMTHLLCEGADYEYLYYALTQAAVDLGLLQTQRETIEKACRAVGIRSTQTFTISAAYSAIEPLVQFTTGGDLVLYAGQLYTEQLQAALTPTAAQEFVVRNDTSYLALVDRNNGDMHVAGKLYKNVQNFVTPNPALKITDGVTLKAFITGAEYADSNIEPTAPYTVPVGSIVLTGDSISLAVELPPSASWLAINNKYDGCFSASYTVALTNACLRSPTHEMLSEHANFSGATWETYSSSRSYTFTAGTGSRTLWYKVKNANGESAAARASAVMAVPYYQSFMINNGDSYTSSTTVVLNNSYVYDPSEYMASEDSGFAGATWQTYDEAPSFTLSSGYGWKTVYFKVQNEIGEAFGVESEIQLGP